MAKKRTNHFQRIFIAKAVIYLPHHALLHIAVKRRLKFLTIFLNYIAARLIVKGTGIQLFNAAAVTQYEDITSHSLLWHGSGRFQHSPDGAVDVLEGVLKRGGFEPRYDAYGIFSSGEVMMSTSFTRSRMVARAYADMHGKGYRENNRYGDALTWVAYYYGLFYARMYIFKPATMSKYYKTWHDLTHDENGHNTWGKKVNTRAEDVWDIFCLGSDITNNYPVLFGVKNLDDPVPLEKIFRDYEARSSKKVAFENITHIEVPLLKVEKTSDVLRRYNVNIPVASIELGEYASSRRSFSQLLGWGQ